MTEGCSGPYAPDLEARYSINGRASYEVTVVAKSMKSAPDPCREQSGLRRFLNTNGGKIVVIIMMVLLLGLAGYAIWDNLGPSEASRMSTDRMFIDAKTGKPFEHTIRAGDFIPIKAPSGENTGYPAELCYWTSDGKVKKDPTLVLVNARMGKPGPTFCPDCGRLVVVHNPPPDPNGKPPPTKTEYESRPQNRRPSNQGDER